ncbi:FRG domain-containing protein [Ancylobacter amanitiformis]|uniref:ATP-dependent Clp protease adapter protein ClpS n=1 Tax=Ancylobacter amanitiformis TaxID=217069 RepID=A0ABU0LST7_9HYPH|nr:FRG domain-containing protein [Ancylobacter amanitiformis]MDQ0511710.1 ATP-dependent Clp protease adapter protein ClpS [Ancylobacter amanitiformis]
MNGQWLGAYGGTNTGTAILELDDMGDRYVGALYAYDARHDLPNVVIWIEAPSKAQQFELDAKIEALHPATGDPVSWAAIKDSYPNVTIPALVNLNCSVIGDVLKVTWNTPSGTEGIALLRKPDASSPSDYEPIDVNDWNSFKDFATSQEPYRYIFRGQESNKWRLRTHFHRTGRAYILRFMNEDIPALHKNVSSLTRHFFRIDNNIENAAFHSLVQHHGYPTPLLDWTHSPFVAAYFAYKGIRKGNIRPDKKVRIFVFDSKSWRSDWRQFPKISPAPEHFSLLDPIALNNPRMVPQQALSSITNLDDVESYIRKKEREKDTTYLRVIDLPSTERKEAMQQLSIMGITAGSLFPGIDGACEQLRERFFDL